MKMADAVALCSIYTTPAVASLGVAAVAGRFAERDLLSILSARPTPRSCGPRPLAATRDQRLGTVRPMTTITKPRHLATIDPDLDRLSRRLRLPYLRAAAPEVLVTAKRNGGHQRKQCVLCSSRRTRT